MKSLNAAVSGLALAMALGASAGADEPFFTELVVFGDSLSDPGNQPGVLNIPPPFPGPPYVDSRFSNGPVFAEYLADIFNVSSQNFAVGGAFTGQLPSPNPALGATYGNVGLLDPSAVAGFQAIGADIGAFAASDVASQISGFIGANGTLDSGALYSVYAGANNYFAFGTILTQQIGAGLIDPTTQTGQLQILGGAQAEIANAVGDLAGGVGALAASGATQFVVPNLPNLGSTPSGIAGNASLFTSITDGHNAALAAAMGELADTLNVDIYLVDVRSLTDDMQANPGKYGLTNTTTPCISVPGLCATDVAGQNQFQFWDGVHPTTGVHQFAALFTADTLTAPRTIASQGETAAENAFAFAGALNSAYHAARRYSDGNTFLFADIGYQDGSRDGTSMSYGHDYTAVTLNAGASVRTENGIYAGVMAGLTDGETELSGGVGGFDYQAVQFGGFAGLDVGVFSFMGAASIANDTFENIERNTGVAGQVSQADGDGQTFSALFEARAEFSPGFFDVAPLARYATVDSELDTYVESGAVGLNQRVFARDLNPTRAELGLELSGDAGLNWRFEGVFVDPLDGDDQTVATALVNVPDVVRRLEVTPDDSAFGRFGGSAIFDLGGFTFEVGAETTTGKDDGDRWGAFGRIGKSF